MSEPINTKNSSTKTNRQAAALLEIARSQLGYCEGANNDTKYGDWYGLPHNPWCMMFISWCAEQAGIGSQIIPRLAYVPYAAEHFRAAGRWHDKAGYVPQPGDLVFFGSCSHIGLVEACNGVTLTSIEGNTSSGGNVSNGEGVHRRQRALSHSWIMGYASPPYAANGSGDADSDADNDGVGTVRVLFDGEELELAGFLRGGQNYIRLRDLPRLAPLCVDYDPVRRLPLIRRMQEDK